MLAPRLRRRSAGTRAMADALQSFLALAKGARGRGAVAVIADATAAPGLFAFGELLDVPNVKEARLRRETKRRAPLLHGALLRRRS